MSKVIAALTKNGVFKGAQLRPRKATRFNKYIT